MSWVSTPRKPDIQWTGAHAAANFALSEPWPITNVIFTTEPNRYYVHAQGEDGNFDPSILDRRVVMSILTTGQVINMEATTAEMDPNGRSVTIRLVSWGPPRDLPENDVDAAR